MYSGKTTVLASASKDEKETQIINLNFNLRACSRCWRSILIQVFPQVKHLSFGDRSCLKNIIYRAENNVSGLYSQECDFRLLYSQECDFRLLYSHECDFRLLYSQECDFRLLYSHECDFRLLYSHECVFRLLYSHECDFRLLYSHECDFRLLYSHECDFRLPLRCRYISKLIIIKKSVTITRITIATIVIMILQQHPLKI
jgi:hypothetical protein